MTRPRISIIRKSDNHTIESVTLENDRGKIFAMEHNRAWDNATRWSRLFNETNGVHGEFYFVTVDRI